MEQENRKCEICGRKMPRAAYIPFNGGMIVCQSCFAEWENMGEPQTISQYRSSIAGRAEYQSDLIATK